MKILMTGSSGLIGTALTGALEARGDEVIRLVRRPARSSVRSRGTRTPSAAGWTRPRLRAWGPR